MPDIAVPQNDYWNSTPVGTAFASGLGGSLIGGHLLARNLDKKYIDLSGLGPSFREDLKRFVDTSNADPENWIYEYANAGSRLSRRNMTTREGQSGVELLGPGRSLREAQQKLLGRLSDIFAKAHPVVEKVPGYVGREFHHVPSFFKRESDRVAEDQAPGAPGFQHYTSFERGPVSAYHQLVAEMPEISFDNNRIKIYSGHGLDPHTPPPPGSAVTPDEALLPDMREIFARTLSLPEHERDDFLHRGGRFAGPETPGPRLFFNKGNGVSFTNYFRDVARHAGLPEGVPVSEDVSRPALEKTLFRDIHSPTLVGHLHEMDNPAVFQSLEDYASHPDMWRRFGNLSLAARMRGAGRTYNKFGGPVVKSILALRGRGALAAGTALAAVPFAPKIYRAFAGEDAPSTPFAMPNPQGDHPHAGVSAQLAGGAAAVGGLALLAGILRNRQEARRKRELEKSAADYTGDALAGTAEGAGSAALAHSLIHQIQERGANRLNPFGKLRGLVVGGPHFIEATGTQNPRATSFGTQTEAFQRGLENNGIDMDWVPEAEVVNRALPGGGSRQHYRMVDAPARKFDEGPGPHAKYDFISQVGATPHDERMSYLAERMKVPRYRMLSDFGKGNFRQPTYWLGRNWMKVHDDPSSYTRLLVPGGDVLDMGDLHGTKPNINLSNLSVNKMFNQLWFQPKTGVPSSLLTMGGGAIAPVVFHDVAYEVPVNPAKDRSALGRMIDVLTGKERLDKTWHEERYDPGRRNILDDISQAHAEAYGPHAKVHVMFGDSLKPNTGSEVLRGFLEKHILPEMKPGGRYHNLVPHSTVPQEELGRHYATARNIIHMPGSTVGELASIQGDNHIPNIGGLQPDENLFWMPGHWSENNAVMDHYMGPSSHHIPLEGGERLDALRRMFAAPVRSIPGRVPPVFDMGEASKVIARDARLSRLGHLGSASAKGLGAAALAALSLRNFKNIQDHAAADAASRFKDKLGV